MDNAHALPGDLAQCHQLLLAGFKQAAELERVLDETAATHEELKAAHQATIVELNRLKQWVFGRRSERMVDGEGQRHLFDLQPEATGPPNTPIPEPPPVYLRNSRWPSTSGGKSRMEILLAFFALIYKT